jgi:hypothetical protein
VSQFGVTFLASTLAVNVAQNVNSARLFVTPDQSVTLWAGVIDDLWKLGKARGVGGPWKDSQAEAGRPSDPYLMTGYDRKSLTLSHTAGREITVTAEIDVDGTGAWIPYRRFQVADTPVEHTFPEGFGAYWIRFTSDASVVATAQLRYE